MPRPFAFVRHIFEQADESVTENLTSNQNGTLAGVFHALLMSFDEVLITTDDNVTCAFSDRMFSPGLMNVGAVEKNNVRCAE